MRMIDADALIYYLSDYQLQEAPGYGANGCGNADAYEAITNCISAIEDAPTIGEQERWIPCSEKLPELYSYVLATYEYYRYGDYNCMYRTVSVGYYAGDGVWGGDISGSKLSVLAWMAAPQMFMGGKDVEASLQELPVS